MSSLQSNIDSIMRPLIKGIPASGTDRSRKRYQDLRSRIIDQQLGTILDRLWNTLCAPPTERTLVSRSEVTEQAIYLTEKGMHEISDILFTLHVRAFPAESLEDVLNTTSSAEALSTWVDSSETDPKALSAHLQASPDSTFQRAGMDWLLKHERPSQLGPFVALLLGNNPRPQHIPQPADLLMELLAKDAQGTWLDAVLALVANRTPAEVVATLILHSSPALDSVLKNLPSRLEKPNVSTAARAVAEAVFEHLPESKGPERQSGCAQMARLVSDILLLPALGDQSKELLARLTSISRKLRATASTDDLRRATWVMEHLDEGDVPDTNGVGVNHYGARQLIQALRQLQRGVPQDTVFEALAKNVGLTPIGEPYAHSIYDPKIHEDSVGGLLPGKQVVCIARGWRFNDDIVMRAKVNPIQ